VLGAQVSAVEVEHGDRIPPHEQLDAELLGTVVSRREAGWRMSCGRGRRVVVSV